jgi:hypothetical protein
VQLRQLAKGHFHTLEEVEEYARQAVQVADQAGLAGADRSVLLPVIFEQVAGSQVIFEPPRAVATGSIIQQPANGQG